jgi:uncharacterized membrane protein
MTTKNWIAVIILLACLMSGALFIGYKTTTAATEYSAAYWDVVGYILFIVILFAFFVIGVLLVVRYVRARIFISEDFEDMSEEEKKIFKKPLYQGISAIITPGIWMIKFAIDLLSAIERFNAMK